MYFDDDSSEFSQQQEKSLYIHQYQCTCSKNRWWGSQKNNVCKRCNKKCEALELEKMIGIGWFSCQCGRKYAGFSQGNVTSKCHGCQKENFPLFIVPGEKANKYDRSMNHHYCERCKGGKDCPIVNKIKGNRF